MNSLLCCPVCASPLTREDRTYKCIKQHSFDMAKEGYVNLLMSSKSTDGRGDDKEMVNARTRFLDGGFYSPLRDKICRIIEGLGIKNACLLDAGCGEGYYTLSYTELGCSTVGIDISKNAVKHAAKRCRCAEFAVASVYHLPLADNSFDIIVNCFSPNAPAEFSRVLKKGGYLIYVVPAPRHLWELKEILYDSPYENEEKTEEYEGFELTDTQTTQNTFTLACREDILSLFHMTPYTWNTPKDGKERLEKINTLTVSADFRIHIYKCTK